MSRTPPSKVAPTALSILLAHKKTLQTYRSPKMEVQMRELPKDATTVRNPTTQFGLLSPAYSRQSRSTTTAVYPRQRIVPQEHRPIPSAAPVEFHFLYFMEQLVYQVLYPLSIPLVYVFRGRAALVNMRLLPSADQTYISLFQLLLSGSLVAAIVCWALDYGSVSTDGGDGMRYALTYECCIIIVGMFFQRMAVATKYAYMPVDEYRTIMRTKVPFEVLQEDQIIYGWVDVSDDLLDRELQLAGKRLGLDSKEVHLHLSAGQLRKLYDSLAAAAPTAALQRTASPVLDAFTNPVSKAGQAASASEQKTGGIRESVPVAMGPGRSPKSPVPSLATLNRAFLGMQTSHAFAEWSISEEEPASEGNDVDSKISANLLARLLFQRTNLSALTLSGKIAYVDLVLCLIVAFIPLAVRAGFGIPVIGYNGLQSTVFICAIYCQFWFPYILLSYLRVSILDYRRRCNALRRMTKLVSRSAAVAARLRRLSRKNVAGRIASSSLAVEDVEPVLPLNRSQNIVAWLTARRLLIHVGLRYFRRLEAYASQGLVLTVGVAVSVLAILLLLKKSSSALFADISFAGVGLVTLVLLSGHLLLMLYYAAGANDQAEEHVAQLVARQAESRQYCHALELEGDFEGAMQHRHCCEMAETAIAIVRNDAKLEPVRIIGITANWSLLQTVAAAAASALSAAVALLKNMSK